ncbi:MAG TPA: DUF4199 domain-containing protein [Saprospiraceae bacterium]|nr:DUF4199 domain-containing protein [Saprospiraceae bacterium]HNT21613.1 DUF4199 domain-containing protein [Saprospiraceae bacterium]
MQETKPGPVILRFGLTGGLLSALIFLIFTVTGLSSPDKPTSGYVSGFLTFAILVTLVVLAIRRQRDEVQGGYINLGQCILVGLGVVLLSTLISSLVSLVYTQFIDPGFTERMMAQIEDAWEAQGMSEEQIEAARSWTSFMKSPILTIAYNLVCFGIGGLILALITGLIMKRERPEIS